MVKSKKSFLLTLVTLLVVIMSLSLVACTGGNEDTNKDTGSGDEVVDTVKPGAYDVTFMYKENGTGAWKEFKKLKSNAEGVVTLPDDLDVYGFSFRAWYKDESYTTKFDGTGVNKDMRVYAKLADKFVTVKIAEADGSVREVKQPMSQLDALKSQEEDKATEAKLTFDSYYTDVDYQTTYEKSSESTVVYARYAAKVVYDNGYEPLKEELVTVGSQIDAPTLDENFVKFYMSDENISFVVDGAEVNFEQPIMNNTTITVLWESPCLYFVDNKCTGFKIGKAASHREITPEVVDTFPVVSIPNKGKDNFDLQSADWDPTGVVANDITVVDLSNVSAKSVRKIIIRDGIKYVTNLSSTTSNSLVEEVVLPSTLEILEKSINGYDNLKGIVIPDSTKIIISSLWKDLGANGYDIDIKVPASVINLVRVPSTLNLTDSNFKAENNMILSKDGKTLVSVDRQAVVNGSVVVPEGVEALQVGMFQNVDFEYLVIPSTFIKVAYTDDRANYPYYSGKDLTVLSEVASPNTKPSLSNMANTACTIVSKSPSDYKQIIIKKDAVPADINVFSFSYAKNISTLISDNKIVLVPEVDANEQLTLKYTTVNSMTGDTTTGTITSVVSGQKLDREVLLETAGITSAALGYEPIIEHIRVFGQDVDFGQVLNSNVEYVITYKLPPIGFTSEEVNGEVIVTGATDGATIVVIPNEIDGKPVVAIKDSAFEGNKTITNVFIPSNVKTIGAKAFKDVANLVAVTVTPGSLAKIGDYAFEGAGASLSAGKYVANGELKLSFSLASLGNGLAEGERAIGFNSFNTPAIKTFYPIESEDIGGVDDRTMSAMLHPIDRFEVGKYYYAVATGGDGNWGEANYYVGIFKVASNDAVISKCEIEWYATAAGIDTYIEVESFKVLTYATELYFGYMGERDSAEEITAHIMSGSVQLYNDGFDEIIFISVSKVDKDAFTVMNDAYASSNKFKFVTDDGRKFLSEADMKEQNADIFTEGWYLGNANSKNSFMANAVATEYSTPGYNTSSIS